jgi:hypothetical protein
MYNAPSALLVARLISAEQAVAHASRRPTRARRASILQRALGRLRSARPRAGRVTAPRSGVTISAGRR